MKIPLYQVDAFTKEPYKGNPAAVCLLTEKMPDAWMKAVALEMSLSETAFLLPQKGGYQLRWFTPLLEVDLCGHATLASSFVLFEKGLVKNNDVIKFFTRSGELKATRAQGWVMLDFPLFKEKNWEAPPAFIKALGVQPVNVTCSGENVIIEVASAQEVYGVRPNFMDMIKTPLHGVVITALSDREEYDFVSRYFAPWAGITEDPVTGSVHACLGPYWGKRLGKEIMMAYQASARGGVIRVQLLEERVLLSGQAVMVFEGFLLN